MIWMTTPHKELTHDVTMREVVTDRQWRRYHLEYSPLFWKRRRETPKVMETPLEESIEDGLNFFDGNQIDEVNWLVNTKPKLVD